MFTDAEKKGYNIKPKLLRPPMSEETKKKIGLANKKAREEGRVAPRSEETNKKIGLSMKGNKRKPHTEEAKKKMRISLKGRIPWNKGLKNSQVPWNKGNDNNFRGKA